VRTSNPKKQKGAMTKRRGEGEEKGEKVHNADDEEIQE
jgi:hypothetical protein